MRTVQNTLAQYGERAILDTFVLPRFGIEADDCAVLPQIPEGHQMVVTMDPCPTPVICLLDGAEGKPVDYWHYGWLTVLINVSDLAAMGAEPMGMLVSTVMPADMTDTDYVRFLDGLGQASQAWDCPILGGNIKDGDSFSATGTAFGASEQGTLLRRNGAAAGDVVCVIGEMGMFWAAVLARLRGVQVEPDMFAEALDRPRPKVRAGQAISRAGVATACMDASDGVGGCLIELAKRNRLSVHLNPLDPLPPVEIVAERLGGDPRNLMLSWGNWELVVTTRPEDVPRVMEIAKENGHTCTVVGELREPGRSAGAVVMDGREVTDFTSERFTGRSYFTHGLDAYADWLLKEPFLKEAKHDGRRAAQVTGR